MHRPWAFVTGARSATLSFAAVDFDFSTDQRELRDGAVELLERMAGPSQVRAFVGPGPSSDGERPAAASQHAHTGGFDQRLWDAMGEQGWLGVTRSEEVGGLGLGMVEVAILCEELGRRVAPAPFAETVVCLEALDLAAADDSLPGAVRRLVAEWADRMGNGTAIGCVVWADGPGGLTARTDGDRWLLTGRPEPTHYASVADLAIVVTGDALYALPFDDGMRPPPEPAMDRTRPLAWVRLYEAPAYRIGGGDAAREVGRPGGNHFCCRHARRLESAPSR